MMKRELATRVDGGTLRLTPREVRNAIRGGEAFSTNIDNSTLSVTYTNGTKRYIRICRVVDPPAGVRTAPPLPRSLVVLI